jgi:glycosyltransferase involved in cell wall biosynthesis
MMLVTGGALEPPSERNPNLQWIFSTSLSEEEMRAIRKPPRKISSGSLRLVIACRQEREKGVGAAIESLSLLRQEFPGITLDVLGDGKALPEFKRLAKHLGLDERIRFHGNVHHDEVIRQLQAADLFCYPTSASEGFPKVVLEALACGLPVITTQVSVLPHLLRNGCGLVMKEATPKALAQAVRHCLKDVEGYRRMSLLATETARQYSLERWRDTIGALMQRMRITEG